MSIRTILFTFIAACMVGSHGWCGDFSSARLENWHQWRGPTADGVAPYGEPPVQWSETKNIGWKTEIPGKGSSSPVVWEDRIFLLTSVPAGQGGDRTAAQRTDSRAAPSSSGRRRGFGPGPAPTTPQQFTVVCVDRKSGKILWQRMAAEQVPHEAGHETNTFASASPITDGEFVYASFGSYGIYCYDVEGNLKWKRDLGTMETRNDFGEGSSPALHGDTLVVTWDHEGQSFIVALDARTGEIRWKVNRDELTTWATPLIVEHKGRAQVITNGAKRVRSYDLASGKLIWECGGQTGNPIASPVVHGNLVYCMTGFRGNAVYAIPLDSKGDITGTEQVAWHTNETGPYIASPVLYEGVLYVTKDRNAILSSFDPRTGESIIDETRLPGLDILYASPVAAADRLYYTDRSGTTLVLEHGPELKVLATNRLDEGIDASPAIVGDQMFVRGTQHLYCIEAD